MLETVHLIRYKVTPEYILGALVYKGEIFTTLERPWVGNATNTSCIPAGEYPCSFLKKSASGKYKNVYHVKDVPERRGILLHNGNVVGHSRGCLLIGKKAGMLGGKQAILSSRSALRAFYTLMGENDFILNIRGDQHVRNVG